MGGDLTLRNKPSVPPWELAEPLPAAEDSSYSRSAAAVKRCTVSGDSAFSTMRYPASNQQSYIGATFSLN